MATPYLMSGLNPHPMQRIVIRGLHRQQRRKKRGRRFKTSRNLFKPSSPSTVYEQDIVSTAGDLVFFFSTMTPKKVGYPTPSGEAEAGHTPQPQCQERSPPHNTVAARLLRAANAPPPKDGFLSY
ncbi:hypothetical protein ACLOJK_019309 [Asimina triloba]